MLSASEPGKKHAQLNEPIVIFKRKIADSLSSIETSSGNLDPPSADVLGKPDFIISKWVPLFYNQLRPVKFFFRLPIPLITSGRRRIVLMLMVTSSVSISVIMGSGYLVAIS